MQVATCLLSGWLPNQCTPISMYSHQDKPDCLSCGACCAPPKRWKSFVEVTSSDADRLPTQFRLKVIKGELATRSRPGGCRCIALTGTIGQSVRCAIHEQRPDTCRRFVRGSGACLKARFDFEANSKGEL